MAAALPGPAGPEITEMLLHTVQDPDARAHDHDDIFELDKVSCHMKLLKYVLRIIYKNVFGFNGFRSSRKPKRAQVRAHV